MASSSSESDMESVVELELKCKLAEIELKSERKCARACQREESWARKEQLRARYKKVQDKIGLARKGFMIHSDTDTDLSDENTWIPAKRIKLDIIPSSPSPLQRPSLVDSIIPSSLDFTNLSFRPARSPAAPTPPPAPPTAPQHALDFAVETSLVE